MAIPPSPNHGGTNNDPPADLPSEQEASSPEPGNSRREDTSSTDAVEMDPLRGKLAQGTIWVASLRWGTLLFSWPVTILLARLLTPQDYGYLALVSVFTQFASMVAQGGIPNVIVLGEALPEVSYRRLHGWSISFYLAAFGALWVAATPIERAYGIEGLRWVILSLSFTLLMEGLTLVPVARMRRDLRFRELPIIEAVGLVTNGIVALAAAFAGLQYWSLVLGYVSGRLAYTILVIRAYALLPAWPRLQGLQKTLKDARNLLVSGISSFLATSSDAWIGAAVVGSTALGGYKFMVELTQAPMDKISGIFLYVASSALGGIREDKERLRSALVRMLRFTATTMFPIFVGIALVSADLVEGLLGDKWTPYLAALQVYCLYAMCRPIQMILQPGAVAAGASRVIAGTGIMLLFILPPSFFLLGDRLGATGLALAWLLPLPVVISRLVQALRERIGFGWSDLWRALSLPLMTVAIMAMGVMATDYLPFVSSAQPLVRLAIQSGTGAVLYVALLFRFQKEDIRWGLEAFGPRMPLRLRRLLKRWT